MWFPYFSFLSEFLKICFPPIRKHTVFILILCHMCLLFTYDPLHTVESGGGCPSSQASSHFQLKSNVLSPPGQNLRIINLPHLGSPKKVWHCHDWHTAEQVGSCCKQTVIGVGNGKPRVAMITEWFEHGTGFAAVALVTCASVSVFPFSAANQRLLFQQHYKKNNN